MDYPGLTLESIEDMPAGEMAVFVADIKARDTAAHKQQLANARRSSR